MATQLDEPRTFAPREEQTAAPQQPQASVRPVSKLPLLLFGLIAFLGLAGVVAWAVTQAFGQQETDEKGVLTHTVARTNMIITVAEDGNVESASNVEIKCEVAGGGTVLWIVEDGTRVEEGDLLVRLDTSALEDQLQQQKIAFEQARALKIQSEENYAAAAIAVREFAEGTYLQQLQEAEAAIQIATENLRSSENVLQFTEQMVRKGFATPLQLEADRSAVQQARFELEAAQTAKRVLTDFTYEKTITELEAARDAAEARLRSDEAALELEQAKLERLEKQIAASEIYAPQSGMVVYANETGRRSSDQVTIQEGVQVREGQAILRLPDLQNMQAKVTVHESRVDQLEVGMPARISVLDQTCNGHVVSIANQPEPGSWFSANVKEYATVVAIDGEARGLRPGMTAHVVILIDKLEDVLALPVSCVVQKGDQFVCYVRTDSGEIEERQVIIGKSNEAYLQVVDGVKEGDVVLRNPRAVVPDARDQTPLEERTPDGSDFGARVESPRDASERRPPQRREDAAEGGETADSAETPGGGQEARGGMIERADVDGDGKLSRDELPERVRGFIDFDTVDANGDGLLDRDELRSAMQNFQGGQGGGPGSGGGS